MTDHSKPPLHKYGLVALLVLLAFAFLGSRGIWDPDEGRYTAVALNMLSLHDWLIPHKSFEVAHWTKPPLTYWTIASSFTVFGINVWAARLTPALAYLFSAWMVGRMASRLAPGTGYRAALIFGTMLLPAGASQLISTDMLLTACEALALAGYVEYRWGDGRKRWLWMMYAGFALAFITKGPPGLLPLLAIVVTEIWTPQPKRIASASGMAVFALIALPWFVTVVVTQPGLLDYFIGQEVVNRVASDNFGRNGEWYGWLKVYGPTLLIGTFPWTWLIAKELRASSRGVFNRALSAQLPDRDKQVFLLAWLLLPLLVFCVARSRLPLYVLPLMVPLALMASRGVALRAGGAFPLRRTLVWCVVLLAVRAAGSYLPSGQNPKPLVEAIRGLKDGPVSEVVFVDTSPRYALRFYLAVDVETVSLAATPTNPKGRAYDESFDQEITTPDARHAIWITSDARWSEVSAELARRGYQVRPIGTPVQRKQLFRIDR